MHTSERGNRLTQSGCLFLIPNKVTPSFCTKSVCAFGERQRHFHIPEPDGPMIATNSPLRNIQRNVILSYRFKKTACILSGPASGMTRVLQSPSYSFTAPAVSPATIYFWKNRNRITIGIVAVTQTVIIFAQS